MRRYSGSFILIALLGNTSIHFIYLCSTQRMIIHVFVAYCILLIKLFNVFRYMGTITGISDLDPVRWKNSQWRNLQVGLASHIIDGSLGLYSSFYVSI
jgi:hypothetical protein